MPGSIPGSTALRILLTAAGVRDPRTGGPLSEAMVFGIAGGIGIGIAAFRYEKGDFSSFYITGRHLWQDYLAYFAAVLKRFGIEPVIAETTGAKAAEKQLRGAVADGIPCIAWVAGYHVITVYGIDDAKAVAWIGDLADDPIEKPLANLAEYRASVKAQKNRLLSIPSAKGPTDLAPLVVSGLKACSAGFTSKISKGPKSWSTLESLKTWADRLHGSRDKESWARMFPRGRHLWQGLTSIHDYIEHYRTGGGLSRPMFADSLIEASQLPGLSHLRAVADRYAELGNSWTALAEAALPPNVPPFRAAHELCTMRAELRSAGTSPDEAKNGDVGERLAQLEKQADEQFPLSQAQCDELLESLRQRVLALYDSESAAHAALAQALG